MRVFPIRGRWSSSGLLLGVGVVVELVMSVWHGTWDVEPILPAVLSGGIYQTIATSAANPESANEFLSSR